MLPPAIKYRTAQILLFTSLILLAGCRKERTSPSWNVDVLAPIATSTLTPVNLLPDSLLSIGTDNALTLTYRKNFFNLNFDTIVKVPDTTITEAFGIPGGSFTAAPGFTLVNITENTAFDLAEVELNKITLKTGEVVVEIRSTLTERTVVTYGFPGAIRDGQPFSTSITVPAGSQVAPASFAQTFDLSGYTIDLTGDDGTDVNTIETTMRAVVDPFGNPVGINTLDRVTSSTTFTNMSPAYAKGYFGSRSFNMPAGQSGFDFFDGIRSGNLDIDQIDVQFEIRNGFGVDARIDINQLDAFNSRTGVSVALNHSIIGSSVNLTRAFDNQGMVVYTEWSTQLNNANSNTDQFLELLPNRIDYSLDIDINPLGNISNGNDFVYCTDPMEVNLEVTMPLCLITTNLTLIDTLDLHLNRRYPEKNVAGNIVLHIDNGFPFEAKLNLSLLDSNNLVLGKVLVDGTVASAAMTPLQTVSSSTFSQLLIPVSSSIVANLNKSKRLVLQAIFNTASQSQHVKIYSTHYLDVKVTADISIPTDILK